MWESVMLQCCERQKAKMCNQKKMPMACCHVRV
jgi:hypothetical protein